MTARDLAVLREGSGEPLLLIHGLGHHRGAWAPLLPYLVDRFDVIAVDLPGFGESRFEARGPRSIRALRDRVAATLANLGVDRPHVAGNSLGGAVALEFGRAGMARSVTALSPAGFFSGLADRPQTIGVLGAIRLRALAPVSWQNRLARSPGGRRFLTAGIYAHPEALSAEQVLADVVHLHDCRGFERTMMRNSFYSFRGALPVPTTIAWGDKDRILPPSQARRAQRVVPGASVTMLPGCGHVPMSDDPEAVAALIRKTADRV
ncbi:alpha/beta fold hydrolase [Mycolicibacterium sp. XJ1819]